MTMATPSSEECERVTTHSVMDLPPDCPPSSAASKSSPLSQYNAEDAPQLNDDELQQSYQNPEPPRELVDQHLIDADNIGETVFSKQWLFSTLMNLLKASHILCRLHDSIVKLGF